MTSLDDRSGTDFYRFYPVQSSPGGCESQLQTLSELLIAEFHLDRQASDSSAPGADIRRTTTIKPPVCPPGALALIPLPRTHDDGRHRAGRQLPPDRSTVMDAWTRELFGVGREVFSAQMASMPPDEFEAWIDEQMAAQGHQRRSNRWEHSSPPP